MYAIVTTGGKQYKVQKDEVVHVEKLNAEIGDVVELEVNMISKDGNLVVGTPTVKGAIVKAEVVKEGKDKKIIVFKYKAKKNVRKRQGHRQPFTVIKILEIKG